MTDKEAFEILFTSWARLNEKREAPLYELSNGEMLSLLEIVLRWNGANRILSSMKEFMANMPKE